MISQPTIDIQRAILSEEPEVPFLHVTHDYALADALAQRLISPNDQFLVAPIQHTAMLLPMLGMIYHHVAQGCMGDQPWMAAFCCLCNAGTLFDARHQGQTYTFAAQGYYDVMVLLADQETRSYWNHLTGVCLHGELEGASLTRLSPLLPMTAGQAVALYPQARVALAETMTVEEMATAERWNQKYRLAEKPNCGEELMGTAISEDTRLPRHDMGLGIWTATTRRYYPVIRLYEQQNVMIDQLDGRTIVIILNQMIGLPTVFYADTDHVEARGDEYIINAHTRYHNGIVYVDGKPTKPQRPNHNVIRWYAFSGLFPGCEIYGG